MTEQGSSVGPSLMQLLFEEAGIGLCLVAPDDSILRANTEWLRSTGYTLDQVVGENIIDLFPADTRDMAIAMYARARAGRHVEVPRHAYRVNGRETWWEGRIAPVPMEGGMGLLITAREVTREVGIDVARQQRRRARAHAILDAAFLSRVRQIADHAPAAVFVKDGSGRFLFANRWFADLFVLPPEAFVGRTASEILPGPVADRAGEYDRRVASGEEIVSEDCIATPRGDRQLLTVRFPYALGSGEVGTFGLSLDLTERNRAEEALRQSEERFRALTEAMPQIVCALAWDGRPEYVNQSWITYSGLDLAATERAGWGRVLHPDDVLAAAQCWRRARELRTPQDIELRYRAADGSYRWFLSRLAPIQGPDGRVARFIGAAMDIDDRKRAEAERERLLADAQEADRRKDEFLGMLSHELRNPLAPIRHSVYILERSPPGSEHAARARAVIKRQADHLTRLVDDLLDVTRIVRGKIELRRMRVDLRDVVVRAGDDFRSTMEGRGLAFHVSVPPDHVWADADATRITQLIGNLLHNAAKFTKRGGEVALSLTAGEGEAELRVRDSGAGIDPPLLPHVFEAFVQGDRTLARTEGGLGLGLALVKGVAELHGGKVRAESAGRGSGATFAVTLPLVSPAAGDDRRPSAPRVHRPCRVLLVDDNADAAESLADIVRLLGHAADIAHDGPSAIEKARLDPPDVVFCDIGLPGMSGYEVAKVLRATVGKSMRLIAVSGYVQAEDVKLASDAGFDAHVAKPCDVEQIERLLAS